jgi:hypothetical protein
VLRAVNERLAPFAGSEWPVPEHVFCWRAQSLAKRELAKVLLSNAAVLRLHQTLTDAGPYTVCVGRFARSVRRSALDGNRIWQEAVERAKAESRPTVTLPGWAPSHGDGCGRVHPESTAPHGLFACYCAGCSTRAGNKQRDGERRLLREAELGHPIWAGVCSACDEPFERTRPNQKRCVSCRAGHRSPGRR